MVPGAGVMTRGSFALGDMQFEVITSTETPTVRVYRVDLIPRAMVAVGIPEDLALTDDYTNWDVAVLEQAVMDCLEGEPA